MNIEIHASLKAAGKKATPVKIIVKRKQLKSIVEQILENRLKNMMAEDKVLTTTKRGPYKKKNKAVIVSPIPLTEQ